MTIDYSALLYDPVYAELGVEATLTAAGTAGEVAITVIDETRPKAITSGSVEVRSVGPAACARIPELAENGIAREDYQDAVLEFNGRAWVVRSYELRGSPNGEDVGEVRFLLKAIEFDVMVDTREDILARLLAVVAAIPNIRSAHRNNVDIPEDQLPAVIVLDGDEESDGANDVSMKQPHRPYNVQMTPGIVVQVQDDNVDLGSTIATFRQEMIKRVLTDTELNEQIVKTGRFGNGAIRYLGCQTDVGWTRTGYAALTAQFMFKYKLLPEDL